VRISNAEQLKEIKEKYFSEVHMREVGEMRASEIIDISVLAEKSLEYEVISEMIKKVYDFFEEKKMDKVKVAFNGYEYAEADFDLKISNFGEKIVINKINFNNINSELRKIFK
jgi:hypothetical protein